jgi:hypothetical protein
MLDGNHHQGLHELPQHDLAGYGLRSLDHRPEVELLKGRANRGGGRGRRSFLVQVRVVLIELPYLAERTPTEIAIAGVSKIRVCARLKAAGEIELRSEFVRNALVLSEAVLARRSDGLFIQTLGVQFPAFDAGDLGADQRRVIPEILGAILRPEIDLLVVSGECLQILGPLLGRCKVVLCRPRERVKEKVFSRFKISRSRRQ